VRPTARFDNEPTRFYCREPRVTLMAAGIQQHVYDATGERWTYSNGNVRIRVSIEIARNCSECKITDRKSRRLLKGAVTLTQKQSYRVVSRIRGDQCAVPFNSLQRRTLSRMTSAVAFQTNGRGSSFQLASHW